MSLGTEMIRRPPELKFGTSGRRGRLADLTQLEVYVNVLGELEHLQSLDKADGGISAGDELYIARDLRPSSPSLCDAVATAASDAGMQPVDAGTIPTPALARYGWTRSKASVMVTGSHIPFDWNGYKLNTSRGELLKQHEAPIHETVRRVRERIYAQPYEASKFDRDGALKSGARQAAPPIDAARREYLRRYQEFFAGRPLAGMRAAVYQHSAVGRDLLVELLASLGAEALPVGRSDTFVPIDTENIDEAAVAAIARLVPGRDVDAVVSTDGDSDRPLVLGIERSTGDLRFFPGDLVGMVVAELLGADAVVVPISCNDAIDRSALAGALEPKTRIGSPYVIAGMEAAARKGRAAVCGWEANGGFLVGSDIERQGRTLGALPTRDAMLPILAVLISAREKGLSLTELFERLPARYTSATLIREFPRAAGLRLVAELRPGEFEPLLGPVARVDRTDGLRIYFASGDVIHLRPSGNADEFRVYACADSRERAREITTRGAEHIRALK